MPKLFKFLLCLVIVIGCALAGGAIGSWWPVRGVPKDEIGAGDGIGMVFYGAIGLFFGALTGIIGAMLVRLMMRKQYSPTLAARPRSAWANPDE